MHRYCKWPWLGFILSSFALLTGCGTLAHGRRWGQDATLTPGWERLGRATRDAALAPETWVPAAGALAFQIGHIDRELADWAANHTPLFGSQKRADQASDYLTDATRVAYAVTALATPSGAHSGEWVLDKLQGLAVGGGAIGATSAVSALLKEGTQRRRPDGSDRHSFPSGHVSEAAVEAILAARNLESLALSEGGRTGLRIGLATLTAATAWGRLEAHQHFPSDVLAGAALGHFLGALINDAFLGLDRSQPGGISLQPSQTGVTLSLHWPF